MEAVVERVVEKIVRWVAENAEQESTFLQATPQWNISAHRLLDYIVEITGVSPEQVGKWVQESLKNKEGGK